MASTVFKFKIHISPFICHKDSQKKMKNTPDPIKEPQGAHVVVTDIITSWHCNTLRTTGPLWGESIGNQWIPLTKGQ